MKVYPMIEGRDCLGRGLGIGLGYHVWLYESPKHPEFDLLEYFGLEVPFPMEALKKKYRELSKKHHPDHGGDEEGFIELQERYEQACCLASDSSSPGSAILQGMDIMLLKDPLIAVTKLILFISLILILTPSPATADEDAAAIKQDSLLKNRYNPILTGKSETIGSHLLSHVQT